MKQFPFLVFAAATVVLVGVNSAGSNHEASRQKALSMQRKEAAESSLGMAARHSKGDQAMMHELLVYQPVPNEAPTLVAWSSARDESERAGPIVGSVTTDFSALK